MDVGSVVTKAKAVDFLFRELVTRFVELSVFIQTSDDKSDRATRV